MANDFSADTDCKALWLISSTLTADGKGTNTLTNVGVTSDGADYKAGSASGVFATAPSTLTIADASLDAGFPLKSGNSNEAMSLGFWIKFTASTANSLAIFSKLDLVNVLWSLMGVTSPYLSLVLGFGYASGASLDSWVPDYFTHDGFYTGKWYHFQLSYDGVSSIHFRLWDDVAGSYIVDQSYTLLNGAISITDDDFVLGDVAGEALFAKINEFVVFSRKVNNSDWDSIKGGTYSGTGANEGTSDLAVPRPMITAFSIEIVEGGNISVPAATVESTGTSAGNADVSLSVPVPIILSSGATGYVGQFGRVEVPAPIVNAIGFPLFFGTAAISVPVPIISSIGLNTGEAAITVPSAILEAVGDGIVGVNYVAVMNILNYAISEYINYNLNSYCLLGEVYLGADETGIYQLYGDTDNGVPIAMEIEKTGMDFGTALNKRALDIFLAIYSGGDFLFEMITEKGSQVYVENNGCPDLTTHRVHPGKGKPLTGRYLGFNIKNLRGADLALTQVSMLIDILSRRARG